MPQTEGKIVDPASGSPVPIGVVREICARGYSMMKDYFGNPDGSRSAIDSDGWFRTGDLGRGG
jgi:fatty-acyl-CoA synthase